MSRQTGKFSVVLVTAPDLKTARKLTGAVLSARVAACVNLLRGVESHYWWQGRMEKGGEVLLVIKTRTSLLKKLEQVVLDHHPYDTPEFVALSIQRGNRRYLDWLDRSVGSGPGS
jgi:periplasmic divalent cation tolerance protein